MLWNLDRWNHTNQNGNLPTEFFPRIHGRLMASWDATVITKATILVARKGSIIIFMPIWHRLTDVTRKAVAAMPVTLDIPIAIFYSYKITSSALLRQNLHQSFLTSYFTVFACSALFSCLHAFFFNLSCKFSSSLMNLSLVGQVHVCCSDGFLFSCRHFFLIYHLSLC